MLRAEATQPNRTSKVKHWGDSESIFTPRIACQELREVCLREAIALSPDTATKKEMYDSGEKMLRAITKHGDNYARLLVRAFVLESLHAMEFTTKEVRSPSTIIADFDEWWKANPGKHTAKILAETL